MLYSRFLYTVGDIYSPPKIYSVIGKNVMSIAINIAGSKLATRILLGHNTLMPTQKIKIEPTQDKLSIASGVISGAAK